MGLNHPARYHGLTGAEIAAHKAQDHKAKWERTERRIHLSRYAAETKRPGQTLQARVAELEAECA